MRSVFFPRLINGPFGDPALYVRIAHRGSALLFDCGDLHSLTPREALKIQAVFISHAHIDHLIGFSALLRVFLGHQGPLLVCGPQGITERIQGQLSGYTWNLIRDYPLHLTIRELASGQLRETHFRAQNAFQTEGENILPSPDGLVLDLPHCLVQAFPLKHGDIPSLAFVLEEPTHIAIHKDALENFGYCPGPWLAGFKDAARKDADTTVPVTVPLIRGGGKNIPFGDLFRQIAHQERGMKISYVTDVSPTGENLKKIAALAADSHLLVIEAVFSQQDQRLARERNHLTANLAGEVARECRVPRFLLFHHSPRYRSEPQRLECEAQNAYQGKTGPLKDFRLDVVE